MNLVSAGAHRGAATVWAPAAARLEPVHDSGPSVGTVLRAASKFFQNVWNEAKKWAKKLWKMITNGAKKAKREVEKYLRQTAERQGEIKDALYGLKAILLQV